MRKLSELEVRHRLEELNAPPGDPWIIEGEKLTKTFMFRDFITAFGFMSQSAIYAEKINHHPEWFNVYRTVRVQLTTHEVQGISEKDFDLAKKMEEFNKGI